MDTLRAWLSVLIEIKSTLVDFHSKAALSFVGHFNYFVMPKELHEQVKDEIPVDIGVYTGTCLAKRPRRRDLAVDETVLFTSMIRSLYRYADDRFESDVPNIVEQYRHSIARLEADIQRRVAFEIKHRVDMLELTERRRADRLGYPYDAAAFERQMRGDDFEEVERIG